MDGRVLPLARARAPSLAVAVRPRTLAAAAAAVAAAGLGYVLARETPLFAIQRIDVAGAPTDVEAQVRAAVAPLRGRSLVGLDGNALLRRVAGLPTVLSARYDRAFPHALRLVVRAERPVAVLRRGLGAWLVSARGRVIGSVGRRADPQLPRIWLPTGVAADPGSILGERAGGLQARALGAILATGFVPRIATVTARGGALVLALRNDVELRLGRPESLRLKLMIARRVLPTLPSGTYLDVGVPERPVAGDQPSSLR